MCEKHRREGRSQELAIGRNQATALVQLRQKNGTKTRETIPIRLALKTSDVNRLQNVGKHIMELPESNQRLQALIEKESQVDLG